MTRSMQAVVPQHATLVPPLGSKPAGQTPEGIPLHRLIQRRTRSVPDIDEKTGKQRWALHPQNNMPLIPLRKPEKYISDELFFIESDGQFNINKIPYAFPTDEQIAAEKRAKGIAELKDSLAETLYDRGMTGADLVALAAKGPAEPEAVAEDPEEDELLEALKAEADGGLPKGPSEPGAPSY